MDAACTNCGTTLPDGAAFCPECGAAAHAAASDVAAPLPSLPPPPPVAFLPPPPVAPLIPPSSSRPGSGASRNTVAGTLGVVGALVLGVASFLAWAEISIVGGGSQTVSGWDWFDHGIETGPLFAVLALAAAALAGLLISQVVPLAVRIIVVAVGCLSLGLAGFAISDILARKGDLASIGQIEVTLEYGIWLLVAGAVLILVAGLVAKHRAALPG